MQVYDVGASLMIPPIRGSEKPLPIGAGDGRYTVPCAQGRNSGSSAFAFKVRE